jgi:ABC-type hemin transport system ATPase subunit
MHEGRIIADDAPNRALSASVLKTAFGIAAPKGGFQVASLAPPHNAP